MKSIIRILICFFVLSACNKEKDIELSNEWIVASITLENGGFLTPNSDYLLNLEKKDRFSLRLDINVCEGSVEFKEKTVEFYNGIACTEACCDSEFAVALASNLDKTKKWDIVENQLILKNDKGLKIVFIGR